MDSLRQIKAFYTIGAHGLQPMQCWDGTIAGIGGQKRPMLHCTNVHMRVIPPIWAPPNRKDGRDEKADRKSLHDYLDRCSGPARPAAATRHAGPRWRWSGLAAYAQNPSCPVFAIAWPGFCPADLVAVIRLTGFPNAYLSRASAWMMYAFLR